MAPLLHGLLAALALAYLQHSQKEVRGVLRVGVLTHHNVKNYGAYLQAYALLRILESLGHEAVTVNFINLGHVCRNYRPFFIRKPRFSIRMKDDIREYLHGYGQFAKFSRALKHLNLTRPVFSADQINALGLDALVVGSDEVWNFVDPGFHPVKFGVGIDVPILVFYAAGTGSVMPGDIPPAGVKEGLMRFDRLSVREHNGMEWVRGTLGVTPTVVLDPTLMYDFHRETVSRSIPSGDYLLVYQCQLDEEYEVAIRKYAHDRNLTIISAGSNDAYAQRKLIDIDPFAWVALFAHARLVLSGTLHGTLFALKHRRNFVSWPSSTNRISKVRSYLTEVGLDDRMERQAAAECRSLFDTPVDYDAFEGKLAHQQEESFLYLRECLGGRV